MALLLIQGLCSVKYNTGDKSCGLSKVFCFEYGCTLHCKYKKQKLRAVFLLLMAKEGVTKTYTFFDRISDALQLWSQELHAVPNLQDQKQYPVIPNFWASFEVKGETRWSMLTFTLHPSHIGGRWNLGKKNKAQEHKQMDTMMRKKTLTVKRAVAFIWYTKTGNSMIRMDSVVAAIDNHLQRDINCNVISLIKMILSCSQSNLFAIREY